MGKYIQELGYTCCFFSDLTDYALYSLSTFPLLLLRFNTQFISLKIFL